MKENSSHVTLQFVTLPKQSQRNYGREKESAGGAINVRESYYACVDLGTENEFPQVLYLSEEQ